MALPTIQHEYDKTPSNKKRFIQTHFFKNTFHFATLISALCLGFILLSIVFFIGKTGLSVFHDVSLKEFFFSLTWEPETEKYGAASFIIGTFSLTLLTMIISVPLSLCIAVFNTQFAPKWLSNYISLALDVLVGIPSIVFGYLGATLLVPFVRNLFHTNIGDGLFSASIVLSLMCIPTIVKITQDSLVAVPNELKEASYGLGSTHTQMIRKVLIPTASSGITTAIILGMARALGETMAVVMVIGNTPQLAKTLTTPTSVLTSNIVMQILDVPFDSTWNEALYMMAFLLLLISLVLIVIIRLLRNKGVK